LKRPVILGAVVVACAASCGGTDGPTDGLVAHTSIAIQGGTLDTTHNFAVGVIQHANNQSVAFCSGVLLAPNLVATARHCVANVSAMLIDCATTTFSSPVPATKVLVTSSPTINGASTYAGVSSITVPPGSGVCGNDIALLILSSNIQVPQYVTPTINPPMTDHQAYTTAVTAIGYGVDTPVDTKGTSAGVRRIREGIGLVCIPNDTGFADCFSDPTLRQFISPNEFEGGNGTCEGDSGSGAFDQGSFQGGKWVAFGVLSRGDSSPEAGTCLGSIYTRFDSWGPLILDAAARAAAMGGYNPPGWTGLPAIVDAGSTSADSSLAMSLDSSGGSSPNPTGDAGGGSACLASGTTCGSDNACCSKSCISYDVAQTPYTCACDGTHGCKAGYDCQRGVCVVAPAAHGGCAVAPSGFGSSPPWQAAVGAFFGIALTAARRRRRCRNSDNRGLPGDPTAPTGIGKTRMQ
jgi:hypothetical protein